MAGGKPWETWEDNILKEYYPIEYGDVALRLPHRTKQTCYARARKLGLAKTTEKCPTWSSDEITILAEYYSSEKNQVTKRLPGRSPEACRQMASRLGLTDEAPPRWTQA